MKSVIMCAVIACIAGCGGSNPSPSDVCAAADGTYSYVPSNGWTNDPTNCPVPTDTFEQVNGPGLNPLPYYCKETISDPSATCSVSGQEVCNYPTDANGRTVNNSIIFTADTNSDASVIRFTYNIARSYSNADGSGGTCNATWDLTATRTHQ